MFTNLTHDHLDAHGSPEHYLASKAQLFLSLPPGGTAVLNASDESYEALSSAVPEGVRELTYGVPWRGELRAATDVCVTKVAFDWHGTRVDLALSANLGGGSIVLRAPRPAKSSPRTPSRRGSVPSLPACRPPLRRRPSATRVLRRADSR